jgi:hypothetical protein
MLYARDQVSEPTMSKRTITNTILLGLLVVASQMLSACGRIVSVEPLLGTTSSPQHWEGAYLGEMDADKRGKVPLLLQLKRRGDGAYDITIHTSGLGIDLWQATRPLDLVGRGEVRIADLGDTFAVAETRCEIALNLGPGKEMERRVVTDMIAAARRLGAMSKNRPHSQYLGPYVYGLMRGTPARAELITGLEGITTIAELAKGTNVEVDKWEGGVGDGILLGSNLLFETDDIHVSTNGAPGAVMPIFAKLARAVFAAKDVKNVMVWTRVAGDRIARLRFDNRYPPRDQAGVWCNLMYTVPSDEK